MQNVILIGMPGSGKSTLGQTLANSISYHFIDTDNVIMETYQNTLMQLIEQNGTDGFIALEGDVLMSLHTKHAIISTGGSAVYNDKAMRHLKHNGTVFYLKHSLGDLAQRVGNLITRGVVCRQGCSTLQELYTERSPLYEKYADITVDLTHCSLRECHYRLHCTVQRYLKKHPDA